MRNTNKNTDLHKMRTMKITMEINQTTNTHTNKRNMKINIQ